MLGVADMHYYDIYPPLVHGDYTYTLPQSKALVLDAVAPLGRDYVEAMRRGFDSRWMDAFARPHKESGAHMAGAAYDVHPYVLMNFNGNYESLTTIAHEWGHAMHSYLANHAQPFATSDYAIFVAEIASTFNEELLLEQMLKTAKDDDERLFYLGSALEGLRGTFFRQAMFAEFERKIHATADRRRAADRREPDADLLRDPEALPRRRRRRGEDRRRRLRRVGLHPALLLRRSTSTSTRPRSPPARCSPSACWRASPARASAISRCSRPAARIRRTSSSSAPASTSPRRRRIARWSAR